MEVNYFGTFAVTQAFVPVLAKNGGGATTNIASVASLVNFALLASYSASKAAAHSLTPAMRTMLKGQGTQVFGVYPGPIDTRMAEGIPFDKTSPADAARAIVAGIEASADWGTTIPPGFLRVLDETTIAFADLQGRQSR